MVAMPASALANAEPSFPSPPFPLETAADLLAIYGSPLYVYQGDRLRQTLGQIGQTLLYPRTHFHFATVVNGNVALLQIVRDCGWGLHANTPGDIYLGLKAGFSPSQIVYSGSNLNRTEMEQVLRWGVTTLNLDSIAQVELCCQVYGALKQNLNADRAALRLGLRLNLPQLTGDSRIGIRPEEFPLAIDRAQAVGLNISGLHFYRGTGTNATRSFTQAIEQVLDACGQLPNWRYLDFGGGFGYPYRRTGAAFDWAWFGDEMARALGAKGGKIELLIEPGRAAIAACGTLLTTVIAVKWQNSKQIVGTDTTVANLSVPAVHGGYREIVTWSTHPDKTPAPQTYPTDICGNTTYSRDYLGRNLQLPALKPGDLLAILDTGAYGYAMSSHFLHRPRPAEVLLEANGSRLIRQREEYSVLLSHQIFEAHETNSIL